MCFQCKNFDKNSQTKKVLEKVAVLILVDASFRRRT